MQQRRNSFYLLAALAALMIGGLAACAASVASPPTQGTSVPAPTVASVFSGEAPTAVPTPERLGQRRPLPTPDRDARVSGLGRYSVVPIFDESLSQGWSLEQSGGVSYSPSRTYAESGSVSLAAQPTGGTGTLYFTVGRDARTAHERDRVLGISFWLNGGDGMIATDDLVVTVVGSNAYPYWVPNDDSVRLEGRDTSGESFLFSETRLYYLGLNRDIPPNTWVEVVLWLDEREFDPDYTYVTGVYIKNDVKFQGRFYVDRLSLLVAE